MYYLNYFRAMAKVYLKVFLAQKKSSRSNQKSYLNLGIFNPAIGTSNLGDFIISEVITHEIKNIFPSAFISDFPSQHSTNFQSQRILGEKDHIFVAGTNLLSSNMDSYNQWKIGPSHRIFLKNKVLLVGVGWWQYQDKPNCYTRKLYKTILNKEHLHSVRDSYTLNKLQEIGIENVVNTSCPTLWPVSPEICRQIPQQKAPKVVTTLTFYKPDIERDTRLLKMLMDNYEQVYLWVQGLEDISYLKSLSLESSKIKLVAPNLAAYDQILKSPDIEYVGTRLHAGVRALQNKKRTLILAVDNRAVEIAKDTNLNVIKRENVDQSIDFIQSNYATQIKLPQEAISKWRNSLPKDLK